MAHTIKEVEMNEDWAGRIRTTHCEREAPGCSPALLSLKQAKGAEYVVGDSVHCSLRDLSLFLGIPVWRR